MESGPRCQVGIKYRKDRIGSGSARAPYHGATCPKWRDAGVGLSSSSSSFFLSFFLSVFLSFSLSPSLFFQSLSRIHTTHCHCLVLSSSNNTTVMRDWDHCMLAKWHCCRWSSLVPNHQNPRPEAAQRHVAIGCLSLAENAGNGWEVMGETWGDHDWNDIRK